MPRVARPDSRAARPARALQQWHRAKPAAHRPLSRRRHAAASGRATPPCALPSAPRSLPKPARMRRCQHPRMRPLPQSGPQSRRSRRAPPRGAGTRRSPQCARAAPARHVALDPAASRSLAPQPQATALRATRWRPRRRQRRRTRERAARRRARAWLEGRPAPAADPALTLAQGALRSPPASSRNLRSTAAQDHVSTTYVST